MDPRAFARTLRARQTSAEALLWLQLRGRRLAGTKWRRQATLGSYVVDFLCLSSKLVVELDGAGHAAQPDYDAVRTHEIEQQGFVVLRFRNDQVRTRLDDVLAAITDALRPAGG